MQNNQLTNKETLTVLCCFVKHLRTYQWFALGWGRGEGRGCLTHEKFDIFSFQLSISPPLGLHFESNSHPWGELIGTHNSLYCSAECPQRVITW